MDNVDQRPIIIVKEGERGQAQGGRGRGPLHAYIRTENLEPTDLILSSSHARKLAFLKSEFRLLTE